MKDVGAGGGGGGRGGVGRSGRERGRRIKRHTYTGLKRSFVVDFPQGARGAAAA